MRNDLLSDFPLGRINRMPMGAEAVPDAPGGCLGAAHFAQQRLELERLYAAIPRSWKMRAQACVKGGK